MYNLFEDVIAGPNSARGGAFPTLVSINDATEVVGPGRLRGCTEVLFTVTFPPGSTVGQLELEGSDDGSFTGTWNNLGSVPWTAANKKEQIRFTGAESFLRMRCSTAVDGVGGAKVTAKGVGPRT